MESKEQFFVAGSITMRSTIFAPLLMAAGSISGIAAEGIHCGGSTHCKTIVNTKLLTNHDLIDEFYEALGNGAFGYRYRRAPDCLRSLPLGFKLVHCCLEFACTCKATIPGQA